MPGCYADTCYCLALCHYQLKQYAASLKYISEVIERGIRDHPELSVGMQTEGVDIRSVGNSSVSLCACRVMTEWLSFFFLLCRCCMRLNLLRRSIFEQLLSIS